jgi:rare lipoprotein A (peptidoglycan hydrolase)
MPPVTGTPEPTQGGHVVSPQRGEVLPEEVELPTLHLKIVIACIVALTSTTALTSEASAAGRTLHAAGIAKQRSHQTQTTQADKLHLAMRQAHVVRGRQPRARRDQQHVPAGEARLTHEPEPRTAHNGPSRDADEGVRHDERRVAHDDSAESPSAFSGFASYYEESQSVASGGTFGPLRLTCAHRSLPFGTHLRVADPKSGRSVVVTVNDRGPYVHGRVLDLSFGAARALGMIGRGVMHVDASVL